MLFNHGRCRLHIARVDAKLGNFFRLYDASTHAAANGWERKILHYHGKSTKK